MRIITVSREFGSGGRELGKRLAAELGWDYYDREIIAEIARKCSVSEDYAHYMLGQTFSSSAAITMGQSFHIPEVLQSTQIKLLREQTNVIKEIAARDRDCVIVGRNADLLLKDYCPLNIFVCADTASKIKRCAERSGKDENLSEKELLKNMKAIDKNRKNSREMISDSPWGDPKGYNLVINTSGIEVKKLIPSVAVFAKGWFDSKDNG